MLKLLTRVIVNLLKLVRKIGRFFIKVTYKGSIGKRIHYAVDTMLTAIRDVRYHQTVLFDQFSHASPRDNMCIFSHYDADGVVDDYTLYFLTELQKANCDIVFVTTCQLRSGQVEKLKSLCLKVIERSNMGRDFGSYKSGWMSICNQLKHYKKLIFTNDSVYGPIHDLVPVIQYGDQQGLDLWGCSDSWEKVYHVQSYFLVFNQTLFNHQHFIHFWKNKVKNLFFKRNIIWFYEIGLSQYFLKKGYKLGAYTEYLQIRESLFKNGMEALWKVREPILNMTHGFWDVLIERHQFPFMKRDLLTINSNALDIKDWDHLIRRVSSYQTNLITGHLKRTAKVII